ncbi:MAG: hypothetical protein ABTD50_06835 [Polyangiaceae bacterium]|jgi:hypothetical protein
MRSDEVLATPTTGFDRLEGDLARTEAVQLRGRSLPYVRALQLLQEIVAGFDRILAMSARPAD